MNLYTDEPLPGTNIYRSYDDDGNTFYAYHGDGGEHAAIDEAHTANLRAVIYDGWRYVRIGQRWYRSWRHAAALEWSAQHDRH